MPVTLKVSQVCLAEHHEPHRRVLIIHGRVRETEWQHTQEQAIDYIESGLFTYYLLHDTRAVPLIVGQTAAGEKFLKIKSEGETPALLLQLSAIPPTSH